MLKYMVESLDSLSEEHKSLYKQDSSSGKFLLQVEGVAPKSKLDEFRNNNISLQNELAKFKDVNLEEYEKLKKSALDGSSLSDEEVETMVNDRVKSMKTQFESETNDLKAKLDKSTSHLNSLLVDSAVRRASVEAGVMPQAMDDVVLRARSTFEVRDGVATPVDQDGKVIYGKDADTAKSVSEWVNDLSKTASHLFTPASGSGHSSNSGPGNVDTSKLSSTEKISMGLNS